MTIEETGKKRYWAEMPPRIKARMMFWAMFYGILGWLAYLGNWWAFVLAFLPLAWWLFRAWLSDTILGSPGAGREDGFFTYTLDYLWGSSIYVRAFVVVALMAGALGSLGWLGTEDIRKEAAKPTIGERVQALSSATGEKAGDLAEGTKSKVGETANLMKEKTGGWLDSVKGFFE